MSWIAPSERDTATDTLEKRLWDAADHFRANPGLKPQEYSGPILGLIFLGFAEVINPAKRIQNLRRTRDLLLSGQVELNPQSA
jgi:type I restriction enzyme M protein